MVADRGRSDLFRVGKHPGLTEQRVRVSATLSCGCYVPPTGEPVPATDATGPGFVVICRYHDEYAIVVKATHRLVVDQASATRWLVEAGVDGGTAASVAADQFPASDTP